MNNLTIITGPMFAGKTEELLRQIHRAQYAQKKLIIFKPALDNRYSEKKIVSHLNNAQPAIVVSQSQEILNHVTAEVEIIFVDELQFFDAKITEIINTLVKQGYQVIAAGLDQDFRGEIFPNTATLLALAEKVNKLTSICHLCQKEAHMTQRLINGKPAHYNDPIIVVGGTESYEARCRKCHIINK